MFVWQMSTTCSMTKITEKGLRILFVALEEQDPFRDCYSDNERTSVRSLIGPRHAPQQPFIKMTKQFLGHLGFHLSNVAYV